MEMLKTNGPTYLIAIDTSGSCNFSKQYLEEILESFPLEASLIFFHREVYLKTSKKYFLENMEEILNHRYQIGGTDLGEVFNFAETNSFTNLVIITDGYLPLPEKPKITIRWILSVNDQYNIKVLQNFGDEIIIKEDKYG